MNDRKIEIIVASNNQAYWEECLKYIRNLNVPEGYELSYICITDAVSMVSAYNEAMNRSDAKYKIYMHHDTFLIYPDLLCKLLPIFENNSKIGMIGVVGGTELRLDAVMWNKWNCGRTRLWNGLLEGEFHKQTEIVDIWDAAAIDGMFMATQYDIRWRDDILSGWDFYDVSQSLEFIKHGYKVVIPFQDVPWCLHDCGFSKLKKYDMARKAFCEAYAELGLIYQEADKDVQEASKRIYDEAESMVRAFPDLVEQQKFSELKQMLQEAWDSDCIFNEAFLIRRSMEIRDLEIEAYGHSVFWGDGLSYQQLVDKYTEVKFGLRRLEYGIMQQDSWFAKMFAEEKLSEKCLEYMIEHCVAEKENVTKKLEEMCGMHEMLVSVIIPTYNRKHTIKRSIDSVLAQTYHPLEIIIIDDCSTDGTMEYVDELYGDITDTNIIYVKNDNNVGPSASRNIGASYASGEYLAFHDSDDEWLPCKLERQVKEMMRADQSFGAVYCVCEMRKGGESILYPPSEVPLHLKSGSIFPILLLNAVIPMITLLMKKSVFFEIGGFNERLNALEDYEFSIRIAKNYGIALVDEALAIAYESEDSVDSRSNDKIITQYYIMDLYKEDLTYYELKRKKFDFVLGEAIQYGNQSFFCQAVLELSKDEDYLRYAEEKCRMYKI